MTDGDLQAAFTVAAFALYVAWTQHDAGILTTAAFWILGGLIYVVLKSTLGRR